MELTDFEKKILKAAAEICSLYAQQVANRCCQDWEGPEETLSQFSEEEKQTLSFNFEMFNSNGEEYDPEGHALEDGMVFAFSIEQAIKCLIEQKPLLTPL